MAVVNICSFFFYLRHVVTPKSDELIPYDIGLTAVFVVEMLTNLIVEREETNSEENSVKKVRDIFKISKLYFKQQFWYDLLTVIPFGLIFNRNFVNSNFFLILKALRLRNVSSVISSNRAIYLLRNFSKNRVEHMI